MDRPQKQKPDSELLAQIDASVEKLRKGLEIASESLAEAGKRMQEGGRNG